MRHYSLTKKDSQWYIPREDYLTAVHYSRRYPIWLAEIREDADTSTAIRYDKDPVQTSGTSDPTPDAAIRVAGIMEKVRLVDGVIHQVAQGMDSWLRFGVCYGLTYDQLRAKGIPCGRRLYYEIRRRYYYELSQRI